MPTREPAPKKRRTEPSSKHSHKFASADEIRRALRAQSESGIIEALTALRNQLTLKPSEASVQVNDERLLLAKAWLEADPGAQSVFSIWEGANARQMSLLAVILGVLSALLTLLSSHYTYHALAQPILRALLSQQCASQLNTYLAGQHTELTLVALKLFNSLSNFAGGRERKSVMEAFAWEMKSLPKLLHMRRKTKGGEDVDVLSRPDIRTLYMLLVLSFIDPSAPSSVKAMFLEQHRDAFTSIFKGLAQDSYSVIRRVLEICWSGLWSDAKLKRTLKIQVFSEVTLSQLLRIYDRSSPEGSDPEAIPADVVHHFLLALCSRPGVGLCFKDRGWYPREANTEDSTAPEQREREDNRSGTKGGKVYNKILANVLRTLRVNEDPRQQELALKVLAACPELVSGFWTSAGMSMEPRLSSKWIANVAFFGSVVSLPVPSSSFYLSESSSVLLHHPRPPPLQTIIDNILPTSNIKTHLSRGLQSTSPLVQHCTALALAKCLTKYDSVIAAFKAVETALEEDEEDGQWSRRRREIEREVRRHVPDFQVIVGFSQKSNESVAPTAPGGAPQNATRSALLAESAHRLLWLYHRLLPSVVAEARFDAGKLLQAIEDMLAQDEDREDESPRGLDALRQLHVLRLLKDSEHFTWTGRPGAKHSNFHILLKAYVSTSVPPIRAAIASLLRHILSSRILFQHDGDEIRLWLDSLPLTRRAPDAKAEDGTPMLDESDAVISFLDDCVQRCIKTPYKYFEELQVMSTPTSQDPTGEIPPSMIERPEEFPSPLLATVLEQFGAKLKGNLLGPSDALAVLSFVRMLVTHLMGKCTDLVWARAVSEKISLLLKSSSSLFPQNPSILAALKREDKLLRLTIERCCVPSRTPACPTSPKALKFLALVEEMPSPSNPAEGAQAAYEIVDRIRMLDFAFHSSDLSRLINAVERLHKPALREVLQHLDPLRSNMWNGEDVKTHLAALGQEVDFELLLIHCDAGHLEEESNRTALVDNVFTAPVSVGRIRRAAQLVIHRISGTKNDSKALRDILLLLSALVDRAGVDVPGDATTIILRCLGSRAINSVLLSPLQETAREGLTEFLRASSGCGGDAVRPIFAELTRNWASTLRNASDSNSDDQRHIAMVWLRYMDASEALGLLEHLSSQEMIDESMVGDVLAATAQVLSSGVDTLVGSLPTIYSLHNRLPSSAHLDSLLAACIQRCQPMAFDGFLPEISSSSALDSLTTRARNQWARRLQSSPLTVSDFLQTDAWTESTVDILTTQLYRDRSARLAVFEWAGSPAATHCPAHHLARILYALYDSAPGDDSDGTEASDASVKNFRRLIQVLEDSKHPKRIRSMAAQSVAFMISSRPAGGSRLCTILQKECAALDPSLSPHLVEVGNALGKAAVPETAALLEHIADLGLKWAVRCMSSTQALNDQTKELLFGLARLIRTPITVKTHLAEPVIATVIQERLTDADAIQFACVLAAATTMKPATVNKFIQTIVQHRRFYEAGAPTPADGLTSRESIADLLDILFHLHPSNTCQPSHIEPLRALYTGSLSRSDRKLLGIYQLFERTKKNSVTALLALWSSTSDVSSSTALEALQSLEPGRVLKTCLEFPNKLAMSGMEHTSGRGSDSLYDPVFVMLLFVRMLNECPPESALSWVQLFRTNVVSLIIRALSAKDLAVRDIAWAQVAGLYKLLETADVQEQPHVLHILNLLKDVSAAAPSTGDPPRIAAYTTLLLAHALRGVFYPSNFIYPLTARFLLQRRELDVHDVPMLYGMLYSASDDWKKERAWIVRFLSDGMIGGEEWRVLKRRHTWDLLASLFQSEEHDRVLRRGVLEVLANVTCNARATTSLILRHALFAWIEMQLKGASSEEALAWMRILENVLAVVNPAKLEAATDGEWRSILGRCLRTLLHLPSSNQDVFMVAVPVILRLALLPGRQTDHLPVLLRRSVEWLSNIEANLRVDSSATLSPQWVVVTTSTLHASHEIFDPPPTPSMATWGACVESLWRACMAHPAKSAEWDSLTSRLLLWRAIAGNAGTAIGEWARKEVVDVLRQDDP